MKKNTRFPLFIDMANKLVLVFGGGNIAVRRIEVLLGFGARITAAAPEFSKKLQELAETDKNLQIVYLEFDDWNNLGGFENCRPLFVLACTDNAKVNARIARCAREYGIMANVCDNAADCDFYFPAIVKKDDLVMGITGNGTAHGKVREFAAELRSFFEH